MEWITANWESITIVITSIVTAASVIAKLTPSETDDKYVGYLLKLVDILAINTKPSKVKK